MENEIKANCDATLGYGFCPRCNAPGVSRERRPDGNDTCARGHTYKSTEARAVPYWVFSFGCGQRHENCYVRIFAHSDDAARQKMFEVFGREWGMQYANEEECGTTRFNLRQLPDIHAWSEV